MACSISVNERFCLKVCVSTHYVSVLCFLEDQPFLLSKTASIHRPCQGCKEYEGVGTLKSKQVQVIIAMMQDELYHWPVNLKLQT